MQKNNRPSLFSVEGLFLSCGGLGFSPKAPGTVGTIGTLPILYGLSYIKLPPFFIVPFFILAAIGASLVTEMCRKKYGAHDPQWIVIDEAIGMTTAWFFHPYGTLLELMILFTLFRFFDIVKVWPASYFDKQVEHGYGVIADDIVAGLYAGLVFLLGNFLYLQLF